MSLRKLWRRFQKAIGKIFIPFLWLGLAYRLLFGTLWGVLIVAGLSYALVAQLTTVQPLSITGLLDWFADLTVESQSAVITVLLTTVGFVAAFWAAYAAWRRQLEIQIRMGVSDSLSQRFSAVQRITNGLQSNLELLKESIAETIAATDPQEKARALVWVNAQAPQLSNWVQELYEERMNYWGVIGTSGYVLVSVRNGWRDYERVGRLIQNASDACGEFHWPRCDMNRPDFVDAFLRQVDAKQLQRAIVSCRRINTEGSAVIGLLRGRLTSGTMPLRFSAAKQMTERRKFFAKIASKYLLR